MTRQRVLIAIGAVAALALLIGGWSLRRPLINAAQADLKTRGFFWFEILGTRIPCDGLFDVGVTVVFQNGPNAEFVGGRLCRPLDSTSPWTWIPQPSRLESGATGK